jgi:hypothetical protein
MSDVTKQDIIAGFEHELQLRNPEDQLDFLTELFKNYHPDLIDTLLDTQYIKEHPDATMIDITKELSKRWGKLTEKEKEIYKSSQDELVNREELKIKDLILKIQVLKNGVIAERNKNSQSEKEIHRLKKLLAECESTLNQKENMIINLSKEKYELQSKFQIEKQKADNRDDENDNTFGGSINGNEKSNIDVSLPDNNDNDDNNDDNDTKNDDNNDDDNDDDDETIIT